MGEVKGAQPGLNRLHYADRRQWGRVVREDWHRPPEQRRTFMDAPPGVPPAAMIVYTVSTWNTEGFELGGEA